MENNLILANIYYQAALQIQEMGIMLSNTMNPKTDKHRLQKVINQIGKFYSCQQYIMVPLPDYPRS